ncbi:MAG TPA: DUF1684 domain-containing protein [Gammaproteobacteria bacterium]
MLKNTLLTAAACALLLAACGRHAPQVDPVAYQKEIDDWRAGRLDRVAGPSGWTTLVGLYWLKSGGNGFGSAADNALQLAGLPAHLGRFDFDGAQVSFTAAKGAKVTSGGKPVATLKLLTDADPAGPTPLESDSMSFYAIRRVDRYGVRVRDTQADARVHFKGLEYFPLSQDWRFEARFEPYSPMKQVPIINILGMEEDMPSPGALVFEVGGQEYRLDAVIEEGETDYFVMFADQTSGRQTYGAGRFMYVKPPVGGKTVLDFNKSYNPPCAFSPYATCPLPPSQNRLPLAITAGELKYAGGH